MIVASLKFANQLMKFSFQYNLNGLYSALPSTTSKGISRIFSELKLGAGVVNLFGKKLRERANAMISIAHLDHRNQLERDWVLFQNKQR